MAVDLTVEATVEKARILAYAGGDETEDKSG
jgi:hypothetical protein